MIPVIQNTWKNSVLNPKPGLSSVPRSIGSHALSALSATFNFILVESCRGKFHLLLISSFLNFEQPPAMEEGLKIIS